MSLNEPSGGRTRAWPRYARIAPDPERTKQRLRLRYRRTDPALAVIRRMLERTPAGGLTALMTRALRIGAALELGHAPPESPPPTSHRRSPYSRCKLDLEALNPAHDEIDQLWVDYDPRKPENRHLEAIYAECEWGRTNKTLLKILVAGLTHLEAQLPARDSSDSGDNGNRSRVDGASKGAADGRYVPTASPRPTHAASPQDEPGVVTIGVDPTRAAPASTAPPARSGGAASLLRGTARRNSG